MTKKYQNNKKKTLKKHNRYVNQVLSGGANAPIADNASRGSIVYTLPPNTRVIADNWSKNKINFTQINFGANRIEKIGTSAFLKSNLTSITIPITVENIGDSAFKDCLSLKTVTFEPNIRLPSISKFTFKGSGITSIIIPNTVITIYQDAFRKCESLRSVGFEPGFSSLITINEFVFKDSGLETIELPNSLLSIGKGAFENCRGLRTITIPESVNKIDEKAFAGCITLESVIIIPRVDFRYGNRNISNNIFEGCDNLQNKEDIIRKLRIVPQPPIIRILEQNKTAEYLENESKKKVLLHQLLVNESVLKEIESIKPLHEGYITMCELMHGFTRPRYNKLISNIVSSKRRGPTVIIRETDPALSLTRLITYLNTENNINMCVYVRYEKSDGVNASGLSRAFCDFIGKAIKIKYMKNLSTEICRQEPNVAALNAAALNAAAPNAAAPNVAAPNVAALNAAAPNVAALNAAALNAAAPNVAAPNVAAPNVAALNAAAPNAAALNAAALNAAAPNAAAPNAAAPNVDLIDTNKKIINVNFLKQNPIEKDNLSKLLYYFMFTMSPLKEGYDYNLNTYLSDFTLMMIFGMFEKIGDKVKFSKFIQDNIIDILENDDKPGKKIINNDLDYYELANITPNNEDDESKKYRKDIDTKILHYIGILFSLDEMNITEHYLKPFVDNFTKKNIIPFPIENLLHLLYRHLYGENIKDIKNLLNLYKDIKQDIEILETICDKIKELLQCNGNSCFTNDDNKLTLYELSTALIQPNFTIDKEKFINMITYQIPITNDNLMTSKRILLDIFSSLDDNQIRFLFRYVTGNILMPSKFAIEFSDESPDCFKGHTCGKYAEVWSFQDYSNKVRDAYDRKIRHIQSVRARGRVIADEPPYNPTLESYRETLNDKILALIAFNGFDMAGGGTHNKNKSKNNKSNSNKSNTNKKNNKRNKKTNKYK